MHSKKISVCFHKGSDFKRYENTQVVEAFGSVQIESGEKTIREICKDFETFCFEGTIAEALHNALRKSGKKLALAESCTGGAAAAKLTALSGASDYFLGSMVVYSNPWKERLLGVSSETLKTKGAVSRETAEEMALGLLKRSETDFAAAITGIAGPAGGTAEKPVGTVYICVAERHGSLDTGKIAVKMDRAGVIEYATQAALAALWRRAAHNKMTLCTMN